jgi:hypothetical protein
MEEKWSNDRGKGAWYRLDDLGLIFATIGAVHTHNVHQRSLYRKIYPA